MGCDSHIIHYKTLKKKKNTELYYNSVFGEIQVSLHIHFYVSKFYSLLSIEHLILK